MEDCTGGLIIRSGTVHSGNCFDKRQDRFTAWGLVMACLAEINEAGQGWTSRRFRRRWPCPGNQGKPGAFPRPGTLHGADAAVAFNLRNPGMKVGSKAEKVIMIPYLVFRTAGFLFRSAAGTGKGAGVGKIYGNIEAPLLLGESHKRDLPGMREAEGCGKNFRIFHWVAL